MAHASKSFVVFTGGEWSEQLHGRTDLAKADSAGRRVRNFVPAQTGRLLRRKGLEFVGAALGECLAGDPIFDLPTWESLAEEALIDPTIDVYGSRGPEELRTSPNVGPIWQVCANIQYCYGPTEEGVTMQNIGDRYRTRWVGKLEDGKVFYRRVGTGEDWTQVGNDLIPQPNDTLNGIGFCFDANARPCFASAIGDDIHIWRWVAGTPTEYSFPGQGPRLFFNGVLQWDNGYWDVMCYFCWNGDLVASFQRENFLTNYTLFTSEDYYLTRVRYLDRGTGADDSERLYIAATGNSGLYGLFRSPAYPLWPRYETDVANASLSFLADGDYSIGVTEAPASADAVAAGIGFNSDGLYFPATFTQNESDGVNIPVAFLADGAYTLTIIAIDAVAEPASAAVAFNADGAHTLAIVSGGSYSEGQTANVAFNADGDYSL